MSGTHTAGFYEHMEDDMAQCSRVFEGDADC